MAGVPQFVVTFRGAEVGRYETAERAMTAARSVIDTELASQIGEGDREPGELPRIEWQPPRVHFPFDAFAYWRHRVQSQSRDAKAAASAPPTAAPTSQISLQKLGISGDESVPPRRQDRMQSDRPPVQGGPQQQRRAQLAPPAQQAQSAPPVQQAQRAQGAAGTHVRRSPVGRTTSAAATTRARRTPVGTPTCSGRRGAAGRQTALVR